MLCRKEEKPKKVWQPPVAPSAASGSQESSGPHKPPRTFDHDVQFASLRTTGKTNDDEEREVSPPVRSPLKDGKITKEEVVRSDGRSVSTLTVTIGGATKARSREPSPVKSVMPTAPVSSPAKAKTSAREPTAQPVSARLASWKQKEGPKEEAPDPASQPVSARLAGWQTRVDTVEKEKSGGGYNTLKKRGKAAGGQAANAPMPRRDHSPQKTVEPTEQSMQSRKNLWQQRVEQTETSTPRPQGFVGSAVKQAATSPIKSRREVSPAKPKSASPMRNQTSVSPRKVAPGAQNIQEKLTALQESWKGNEIAEKIRKEREAEMAALNNRWQNGVLREDSSVPAEVGNCVTGFTSLTLLLGITSNFSTR